MSPHCFGHGRMRKMEQYCNTICVHQSASTIRVYQVKWITLVILLQHNVLGKLGHWHLCGCHLMSPPTKTCSGTSTTAQSDSDLGNLEARSLPWALCHVLLAITVFAVWQDTLSCWVAHYPQGVYLQRGTVLGLELGLKASQKNIAT